MKNFTIIADISIKKAMEKLSKEGSRCLTVLDDNDKFLGTITDGDIRKALLSGLKISDSISKVYNKNSTYLVFNKFNDEQVRKLFTDYNFDLIPVVY